MEDIMQYQYLRGRWQVLEDGRIYAEFSKKEDAEVFLKSVCLLRAKKAWIIDLERQKRYLIKFFYQGKCPECGGKLPK